MPPDQQDKLDQLMSQCAIIAADVASLKATISAWQVNIERFWAQTMPKVEGRIDRNEDRLEELERAHVATRTKLAVYAVALGTGAAVLVSWLSHLFDKGN
jgi:anti-sigma factor RsiW